MFANLPDFSHLSRKEASFVRWTLAASQAYRVNEPDFAQRCDRLAHDKEYSDSSENAYNAYHAAYYVWRDNGFAPATYGNMIFALRSIIYG